MNAHAAFFLFFELTQVRYSRLCLLCCCAI